LFNLDNLIEVFGDGPKKPRPKKKKRVAEFDGLVNRLLMGADSGLGQDDAKDNKDINGTKDDGTKDDGTKDDGTKDNGNTNSPNSAGEKDGNASPKFGSSPKSGAETTSTNIQNRGKVCFSEMCLVYQQLAPRPEHVAALRTFMQELGDVIQTS
jgi:hypothetical protein